MKKSPTDHGQQLGEGTGSATRITPQRAGLRVRRNILQTAREAGCFTTLVTAVESAGLAPALAQLGPLTVFAPHDDAFAALPEGTVESLLAEPVKLTQVLTYHLVPGWIGCADIARFPTEPTLNGERLPMSADGSLHVDGAILVHGDIEAANGVLHVIDRVLLPAMM